MQCKHRERWNSSPLEFRYRMPSQNLSRVWRRTTKAYAPVLVVLLVVEPRLMRVVIRIAIGIYERAKARSGPMS